MQYGRKEIESLSKSIKAILAPIEITQLYFEASDGATTWRLVFTDKRLIVTSKESGKRRRFEIIPYRSISHYAMKGRTLTLQSNSAYAVTTGLIDSDLYLLTSEGGWLCYSSTSFSDVKNGNRSRVDLDNAITALSSFDNASPVARNKGEIKSVVHGEFENNKFKFEAEDIETVLVTLATYV